LQRIAVVAALKPQPAEPPPQPPPPQQQQQGPDAGSTITAPAAAASLSLEELRGWAAARLPPYELPAELRLVAANPRNALGKVNKKALRQQVFGGTPSCADV
jgi:acyl-CoA synthetase (AMP-forming)/AMP-acid ligase II